MDYEYKQKGVANGIELGTGVEKYFTTTNSAHGQMTGELAQNSRIPTVTGVRIRAEGRITPLNVLKDNETPERRHMSRQSVPVSS